MHLPQHPELLDKLAASYALGTLRGGARRRFETLAREQAPVRAAALIWQARIGSVAELQTQILPEPVVWTRIDNLVQADVQRQAMRDAHVAPPAAVGWLRSLFVWRGAAAAGVAAAIVAMVVGVDQRAQLGTQIASLQTQLQAAPQIKYVAVLADGKADPSMLVTFDASNNKLLLQRVGGYQEASDKSLQLWALPPKGGPRSLGVLGTDKLLRLTAGEGDVHAIPTLAITLEPKGGVPVGFGPTGPVLFKGALIQKML
ncbi:anti-sigma factor [Rhodoferax sp.]|uniref:anti-sigma factor n=1 Tax=Rhodoferax sp. TaxID=50421 RepID=UPI0025E7E5E5|nr:anti-sigma factor [Rhodoferax sp.]